MFRSVQAVTATAVFALTAAVSASTQPTRQMPSCGANGITLKIAPWRMGIQEAVGVRVIGGTKYLGRAGESGPSCDLAKRKVAQLARLRTARAVRLASFAGLHCRIGRPPTSVLWVRPRGAWGGCWSARKAAPAGRYFFWELPVP
jgi:hypothetical protein